MEAHMFLNDTWLSLSESDEEEDSRHMSFQLRIVPCYVAMLWGILTVDVYSLSHGCNFAIMVFGVVSVYFVSFLWLVYSLPSAHRRGEATKSKMCMDPALLEIRRARMKTYLQDHQMSWLTWEKRAVPSTSPVNSYELLSGSEPYSLAYCRNVPDASMEPIILKARNDDASYCSDISGHETTPSCTVTTTSRSISPPKTNIGDCCALCLESYEEKERIVRATNPDCIHWYHEECFVDYLMSLTTSSSRWQDIPANSTSSVTCPTCRQWYCSKEILD